MKIISLEDYTKINEAVIGLRSLATKQDIEQLSEAELNNLIKFLLLQSGAGAGICESTHIIKEILLDNDLINESTEINLEETLNESWDDDISTGIKTAGIGAAAGAVGLAAYISFLFKKKKIRKAWDAVKDIQIQKVEKGVEAYEDEMDLNAKVDKEKFEQFKADKEQEIKDIEEEKKKAMGPEATEEITKEQDKGKVKLNQLDPQNFKAPEENKETKEEPSDKTKEEKPEKEEKKPEKKEESLKEAEDEGGSEEKGKLQLAQDAVKDAQENEEDEVTKAKEKNKDKKEQITKDNQKIEKSNKPTDKKTKAKEKNSKELKKISDDNAKIDDEGTGKVDTAKKKVDDIKKDIQKEQENQQDLATQKEEISSPEAKEALGKKFDDKIADLRTKIKDEEAKTKPDPEAAVKKQTIKDGLARDLEQLNKEEEAATEDANRISGIDSDGKATSLGGKALGLSKNFAAELKATNKKEVLKAEKDALSQKAAIDAQQIGALADKAKAKEQEASAVDAKIQNADQSIADNAEKVENDAKGVDAPDDDIKNAEAQVKAKEAEKEAEEKEEAADKEAAKKEAMQKQVDKHQKTVEDLQKKISGMGGDRKKEAQYKLDKAKDKLSNAKDALQKLGESFHVKFQLALIETELNEIVNEYGLILEKTRKELIPEEDEEDDEEKDVEKKEAKKDDEEKDDEADANDDGEVDPEEYEKQLKQDSKEENKDNPLIGKTVILQNMRDRDEGHLEKSIGKIVHSFKENEREAEGDMPRRSGDPEIYKIELENPKDPMYPEINLTKEFFKEHKKEKKEEKTEESISDKFRKMLTETLAEIDQLTELERRLYKSKESDAIKSWERFSDDVIGKDGQWSKAPEGSHPKAISELKDILAKYQIK